ncbi:MAG: sulfurtransferase TusA family protein [Thermodesulfobacteriota bacterium]|nr:sulfurtransferase TusA family protein [Thermodesulfobacteriota bacterium]
MSTVDARGLSCPQPVLLAIEEIESGSDAEIVVLVDTETSRENVTRAATSKGCTVVNTMAEGEGFKITLKK